ncbi:hypothetical protein CBR_g58815 [Chara braunii]|uniref:Uncharacterized protein n=1 Tax=Chara braunii TaxID=69332 RepID=A0A388K8C8_CHABU|nr:hypothetical protein CBR_g58815 [Chara braunii]|eukprot:GBG66324.1 hypothetical protein CBR_g58815 [Chara braunii]
MERARRMEWEQRAHEQEKARRAEVKALAAEAERAAREAEKQRKREEEQLKMAKVVEVQLSLRLGDIQEEIKTEVRKAVAGTLVKSQTKTFLNTAGKSKEVVVEDVPSSSGAASDVEAITKGTGSLSIQEKRKRGDVETPVGDSPPVTTPAKRSSKRVGIRPVRFSDRFQRARSRIAAKKGNRGVATKALTTVNLQLMICAGMSYPWVRGHVRARLRELENVPPLLMNGNNVLKARRSDRVTKLGEEIEVAFANWINVKGQTVHCLSTELIGCLTRDVDDKSSFLDKRDVFEWKNRLEGLVLPPLDRNPGETLVICPSLYDEGMMDLFIRSVGYLPVVKETVAVVDEMKADLKAGVVIVAIIMMGRPSFGQARRAHHTQSIRLQLTILCALLFLSVGTFYILLDSSFDQRSLSHEGAYAREKSDKHEAELPGVLLWAIQMANSSRAAGEVRLVFSSEEKRDLQASDKNLLIVEDEGKGANNAINVGKKQLRADGKEKKSKKKEESHENDRWSAEDVQE